MSQREHIRLEEVATHNLKNIDVSIPLRKVSVVTGVSGSGKSSLVFDTLYGEAYRRYVESLSSFARQYLKALPKPAVKSVRNLPPAIAVKQTRSGATSRSTVATMTEMNDILRILFTHLAKIVCPSCQVTVERESPELAAQKALAVWKGRRALVTAPLATWHGLNPEELRDQLVAQGFTRVRVGGAVVKLAEATPSDLAGGDVVVDRLTIDDEGQRRLVTSLALAMKAGRGKARLRDENDAVLAFTAGLDCPGCGKEFVEPSLALLSFNHPLGACSGCQGFGMASEIDWQKVIPDNSQSLATKGVIPWNFGQHTEFYGWAAKSAAKSGIDLKKPFSAYSKSEWDWLKNGRGKGFDGVVGYFKWLDQQRYKAHYRIHAARFRHYVLCPQCQGARLNERALAFRINGETIADVSRKSIETLANWLDALELTVQTAVGLSNANEKTTTMGVSEAFEEAKARVSYLQKIGVGYLTLDRTSRTLSGGELQRINMARCLGSALTETLFCLDEPTSGLHARDSRNLLDIIYELRDQGNTVVVVEHEKAVIDGADHVIEIGPKAGHEGGYLTYDGPSKGFKQPNETLPAADARPAKKFIELTGARTHNLKDISVRIPAGALTAVCGVSGSGKTSLVQHTLYPLLAEALGQEVDGQQTLPVAQGVGPKALVREHAEVMLVSQATLGRSSRSNIATYLGIFDEIRKLLAETPEAKKHGLKPGAFSFNTPGGRCETCKGLGRVVEDLSFLGEMEVTCPSCAGKRFEPNVLSALYRGKSLIDILGLTVAQARAFFHDRASIAKVLDTIIEIGLGYLTLGQATSSFSGGEAQRLKLASLMKDVRTAKPSILILDEPSTGLSDRDVTALISQLRALTRQGHTIIVVEHHLGVLRASDWLLEIGPDAAQRGGQLVYQGPPAGLNDVKNSVTAPYLWKQAKEAGA